MSRLEATAKPLIQPLLEYRGRHLHRRQQRELATWALMKATVFDATHPKRPAVLVAHREHLFAKGAPPPENLRIWLATCDAEQVSTYAYQGIKLTPPGAPQAPDEASAYIVTFTIGPLVVQ